MNSLVVAVKDEDKAHPIASDWRLIFAQVVDAFVAGDFGLSGQLNGVEPVDSDVAAHNRDYVSDYGEKLVSLIDDVWQRSCAQWMGDHWDVIIDLCTEAEGVSDLALTGEVRLVEGQPKFKVGLIYVP